MTRRRKLLWLIAIWFGPLLVIGTIVNLDPRFAEWQKAQARAEQAKLDARSPQEKDHEFCVTVFYMDGMATYKADDYCRRHGH